MSAATPKCGAKTRKGTPCTNVPVEGAKRCRMHGGGPRSGAQPIHGRYSKRFQRLEPIAQSAIDAALRDPDLLDLRRPVAVQQVILQEAPLLPSEDLIREFAMRLSRWRPNFKEGQTWDDQPEPSQSELDLARMTWLQKSAELTEAYGFLQARSAKAVALGDVISKQLVPVFAELGLRMTKLAGRYVVPEKRDEFDEAFRMEVRRVVATIVSLGDD